MSLRILIADDEAVIRMGLRTMLEERGYSIVGEAADGRRALDLATKVRPDLVFLDIKMPGMDGLALAEELSQSHRVPVILLTAYGDRTLVDRARRAGAMAYLVKPLREEELVPTIEMALGRFRDLVVLSEKVENLEESLEARKVVERAKGVLMQRLGLSEEEAFLRLQRTSRAARRPMREVAQEVLDGKTI